MAWKLGGSYFETCSCEVVCPCTASLAFGATYDRCRVTLVFRIADGEVEGTDVSGLTVAAIADTPKVMTDGNWRLGVFIDAAADDAQAQQLGAVFSGQLGGPMAGLGSGAPWPPSRPLNTAPGCCAWASSAAASTKTPRRHFPSVMTFGVSAMAAIVRPLMSVPSTSPSAIRKSA